MLLTVFSNKLHCAYGFRNLFSVVWNWNKVMCFKTRAIEKYYLAKQSALRNSTLMRARYVHINDFTHNILSGRQIAFKHEIYWASIIRILTVSRNKFLGKIWDKFSEKIELLNWAIVNPKNLVIFIWIIRKYENS